LELPFGTSVHKGSATPLFSTEDAIEANRFMKGIEAADGDSIGGMYVTLYRIIFFMCSFPHALTFICINVCIQKSYSSIVLLVQNFKPAAAFQLS
jgi:hypothetical protein